MSDEARGGIAAAGRAGAIGEAPGDYLAIGEELHRGGWSIGDVPISGGAGRTTWVVLGRRGDDLLLASGATRSEAWREALERSRRLRLPCWAGPTRG